MVRRQVVVVVVFAACWGNPPLMLLMLLLLLLLLLLFCFCSGYQQRLFGLLELNASVAVALLQRRLYNPDKRCYTDRCLVVGRQKSQVRDLNNDTFPVPPLLYYRYNQKGREREKRGSSSH